MKSCSTCASPLYSEVKYCPFCGTGTAPGARPKQAAASVPPPAPAAAADAVAPVSGRDSAPAQPAPTAATAAPAASAAPAGAAEAARPAAQGWAAGKNGKAAAPGQLPPAAPAATTPPPRPKSGKGKWFVIGAVLVALFIYIKGKPDPAALACDAALEQGNKALLAKDLAGARAQAAKASGACTGALAREEVTSLLNAVAAAQKKNSGCQRSFRIIGSHLEEHKLASARTALNALSGNCADDADATALRSRLSEAAGAADSAQAALRTALDNKDLAGAKANLQALKMANRENPDLPALKAEVAQLATAAAAPVAATPADTPAPAAPVVAAPAPAAAPSRAAEPVRERTPARRSAPESAANPKAEMAAAFLHDAETALAQKKFDAARTYVDSARRVDPANPRLDSLTQQIRDRERQVLQQETIIR